MVASNIWTEHSRSSQDKFAIEQDIFRPLFVHLQQVLLTVTTAMQAALCAVQLSDPRQTRLGTLCVVSTQYHKRATVPNNVQ